MKYLIIFVLFVSCSHFNEESEKINKPRTISQLIKKFNRGNKKSEKKVSNAYYLNLNGTRSEDVVKVKNIDPQLRVEKFEKVKLSLQDTKIDDERNSSEGARSPCASTQCPTHLQQDNERRLVHIVSARKKY